jgi:pimeloyl-ACP methyl ester carboxylesterase
VNRVVYLHGFASSPQSSKAQFFKRQLEACGIPVEIPRLDGGDFEHLTITSQLAIIEQTVGGQPATLFGSSLGGYLAALYAARHPAEIDRLVLLAPAFQFPSRWRQRHTKEGLKKWEQDGFVNVYHYGEARTMRLSYRLMQDSVLYEEEPDVRQPTLIFHGTKDDVVPPEVSQQFVAKHPNAELLLMDSGHELTNVLESMWQTCSRMVPGFCGS